MSFGEAIATCIRRFATFSGRADRPEFWYWLLFYFLIVVLWTIVDEIVVGISTGPFSTIATLALLLPTLAAAARRLHDIDRSGWWMLLVLVPLIGAILLLVWMSVPGRARPNRFGPEPA